MKINEVRLDVYPAFMRRFSQLPDDIKRQAAKAINDLRQKPMPKSINFEKLRAYMNPSIFTIHATRNHSHKISFEIEGDIAIMRKIGTHKEIDRSP
ncbi:TPA: hypothetical protein G8O67_001638 [Salmonella enterica]|uniref:Type II toxin-antitoxin system RelE/ParE family toxin n=1 Tax=Salmonella enterica TaxID=28901 RepID=A0A756IAR8_SALER|nr:hypothetical protein [Salmonella enterica]